MGKSKKNKSVTIFSYKENNCNYFLELKNHGNIAQTLNIYVIVQLPEYFDKIPQKCLEK